MHEKIRHRRVEKFDLPIALRSLIHDCDEYKAGPPGETPVRCHNCMKTVPWFFFKCTVCDEYFIKDFRHPKFCSMYPTCWQHTLELPWEYCTEHRPHLNWYHEIILKPTGANPRTFSDSELADVFDFD